MSALLFVSNGVVVRRRVRLLSVLFCIVLAPSVQSCDLGFISGFERGESPGVSECIVLNDTGFDLCALYPSGYSMDCEQSSLSRQDSNEGRDFLASNGALEKVGAGRVGFDFTKISSTGAGLDPSAELFDVGGEWSCTQDNVTGAMWEMKSSLSNSPRYHGHTYSHYETRDDGVIGYLGSSSYCQGTLGPDPCNSENYIDYMNSIALCGRANWRLPTRQELLSVVDYGSDATLVDYAYFPRVDDGSYRAELVNYNQSDTFAVDFSTGNSSIWSANALLRIMLVSRNDE